MRLTDVYDASILDVGRWYSIGLNSDRARPYEADVFQTSATSRHEDVVGQTSWGRLFYDVA